ncbi:prostate androgen-regulated mucin-like protein 1 [Calypte anna]|nr:prostate androgen-regulated mucin-like protein 1 [Calypte anna]
MGCCCRCLLALLLLLPAGLGDGSTASPLIPTNSSFSLERTPAGPGSKGAALPTPAPGQPWLPTTTGPAGDEMSPGPAEGHSHNATTVEALSPAPVTLSSTTAATIIPRTESPSVASKPTSVPPTLDSAPALWTASTATLSRGTTDLGTAPSPTPAPASSSNPTTELLSTPGTVLSPTPFLTSPGTTRPPALTKDVPSQGTMAVASSLAVEPTSLPVTVMSPTTDEAVATGQTTLSTGVIMEEVPRALSAGSIVAITVTVIVVVVLVFGVAAYLKIRHSSYGRLLDDHDYGSWGNYNNPLYDDS